MDKSNVVANFEGRRELFRFLMKDKTVLGMKVPGNRGGATGELIEGVRVIGC